MVPSWANQFLKQLLMEQFDTLPIQYRHIEHTHKGVWLKNFFRLSVRNVLFPYYLGESLLDFHQILQTCSYMQDKYFRQKSKG